MIPDVNGEIRIKGGAMAIRKRGDAMAESVALVPEARATRGIPAHLLASNMILAGIDRLSAGGFVDDERVPRDVDVDVLEIMFPCTSDTNEALKPFGCLHWVVHRSFRHRISCSCTSGGDCS
ncbi:hypothetical protein [Rhizobium sp. Leaf386]|uniref:hypothetical protein n=1 Tax=Rhizobium sp. Leaf386 TaxID=1736359 RepID=UPI000712CA26|nr:hypothetical protein [Rhizobium sp. Leaf386]KQT06816.1 hypothetical protein ASG50_13965 [Rhizobium sp. Leaf386]KQU05897.1 hypothetical protein ASG68_24330 [Rhizobium sp. Leaf453]